MPQRMLLTLTMLLTAALAPAQPRATIRVLGQPNLTSGEVNHGGAVDAASHNYPLGIAVDPEGGIYVADRNNHRVLFFANDGNSVADRVYGQHGSFTAHISNNDGDGNSGYPSAKNLSNPTGVALDSKGGIFVNDRDDHRILHFVKGSTTADRSYGQFGSFQVNMANNDGGGNYGEPSAGNIGTYTLGVVVDKDDGLYVSDATNHRVLYFANDGNTIADRVYGQWDDMTTGVRNNSGTGGIGAPSARSLNFPRGLAVDSFGGLYVADRDNNRVLYFAPDGDTSADRVYGQSGSFIVKADANDGKGQPGAPTADNLSHPKGVAVDAAGGIYIADSLHHRILYYAAGNTTAERVWGQAGKFDTGVINNDGFGVSRATGPDNLNLPQNLWIDATNLLYATDTGNSRTLVIDTKVR